MAFSIYLQNELEVASAAKNVLKDACDNAEKAKEDLMERFKVSQVFIAVVTFQPFAKYE